MRVVISGGGRTGAQLATYLVAQRHEVRARQAGEYAGMIAAHNTDTHNTDAQ
jgi:Trk K+ transport system NAD-binding subunit